MHVSAKAVIARVLHSVKHIVALRVLGELMKILAFFGVNLRVD